ncbi:MAG: hypothetical protein R3194_01550 [Limnobacter sp.]|nr:hypothetical protein [Limnobacter sp.]
MRFTQSNLNALLVCDYPVKEFVYKKVCKRNLEHFTLHIMNELLEPEGFVPNIVVIDINIMPELERDLLLRAQQLFPNSHILLMLEDDDRLSICRGKESAHLTIQLGKRANHSTLEDLLWVLGTQETSQNSRTDLLLEMYSTNKCA